MPDAYNWPIMKSPFPGMDPYLEARWSDVHLSLLFGIQETLQPSLPAGLRARAEERILLEDSSGVKLATYRTDVSLVRSPGGGGTAIAPSSTATVEPFMVRYYEGPELDRFLQIIDSKNGNRVVTAIEVLSPWNKSAGRLNKQYRKKLNDYARAGVSVVEIDLLRSSRRRLPIGQEDVPPERRTPYVVCVRQSWDLSQWAIYPVALRVPLPRIPIPLREGEAEVAIELQPLIDRAYAAGGHDDIDYSVPPEPPLKGDDAAWASQLLAGFTQPASGDANGGLGR